MFKHFFLSELRYTLRQPMVYLFFLIVFLLVFAANASDNVTIGGAIGNVHRNAPHIITTFTAVMCIFGLLFAAAFFNNAALRDHKYNFQEILYTKPIDRFGYFFGRFTAALLMATFPLLGVFCGVSLGTQISPVMGWIEPDRFGPIHLSTFVSNYFLFVLPNMLFAGSIIYTLAHQFKSTMTSFVGALLIIVIYLVTGQLLSDIDNETIGAMLDTFAIGAYNVTAKYYTPLEKNTLNPSFSGLLMYNRLIWITVSLVILAIAYIRFSFAERKTKPKKIKKATEEKIEVIKRPELTVVQESLFQQFKSFFWINFKNIYKHVTFRILLAFSTILLLADLISGFEYYGLQSYPLTYRMADAIDGTTLFVMIILVFFSGELIWRDREAHINEVIDATPHASLISLFAKTLSLFSLTLILHAFFVGLAILYQLLKGYFQIELSTYFWDFIYNSFPLYLATAMIVMAVQVMVNNKYIGYVISIIIIVGLDIILAIADIQSNMVRFMASPYLIYSDMNGFGPSNLGVFWFNTYWVLGSLFVLVLSGLFWARGTLNSLRDRLRNRWTKIAKSYKIGLLSTGLVWIAVASYVYYNTQVLYTYKSQEESELLAVDYEEKYKRYKGAPHPKVIAANYTIDIYPNEKRRSSVAHLQLINPYDQPIDTLLINASKSYYNEVIDFSNAKRVKKDDKHKVHFYVFDPPFVKGDTLEATITQDFHRKGFSNGSASTSIVRNGTFFNNFSILPSIGYDSGKILSNRNKRRKYKLPPKDRMPALEEACGPNCAKNYLTDGYSDFIDVETVISTSKDQIAIAPGSLIEEWTQNDRNYYRYRVDHPSQNFYSFISADYTIAKRDWNGVAIEIYHDAKHGVNIERMLDAVERSLEYYTKNFGPYTQKQCRIIEFPRFSTFAQAFPGTMPYSEAFGFVIDLEDEEQNNIIDAVIAHEMAHQWWAHQVVGANMQGGTMMSESFSEYSALMTMKKTAKTPMKMREFLKYNHDRYLRGRAVELEKELPLYKVENQSYIHYGKGSIVLYALQDYIGEDKVNAAMRSFLEEYKYTTPYPTSLNFLEHLDPQVPDSLKYLIDDWFKEITLYDNRLLSATARALEDGKYAIDLEIEARKIKADSLGNEQQAALNEWIDVGVFADADEEILMHQQRVKFTDTKSVVTLTVDSLPAKAAIDPRHILIDRVFSDNTKTVKLE